MHERAPDGLEFVPLSTLNSSIVRQDAGVRHYVRGWTEQPRATVRAAIRRGGSSREQFGQDFRNVGKASPFGIAASVVTVMDFQ